VSTHPTHDAPERGSPAAAALDTGGALFPGTPPSTDSPSAAPVRLRGPAGVWRRLRRQRGAVAGGVVLLAMALAAVLAPLIAPHSPTIGNIADAFTPPGRRFLLGTDYAGRDMLSRVIFGARISLTVGLVVQATALVVGTALGLLSGYYGGWMDDAVSAVTVTLQAFPGILLAIAVVAMLGPGIYNVFLALGLVAWPSIARLVRGQTLALKEQQFVESARAIGASGPRILRRHILPNCMGPLIVIVTLGVAGAILSEAALGFLGLGVQPPVPSWGSMLAAGRARMATAPWLTIFPGLAIFVTVLSLNMLGDGLRDVLDPRLRR
jgi:ABC-type dipeptide/oligopeptide/nickel transport system permease subunit